MCVADVRRLSEHICETDLAGVGRLVRRCVPCGVQLPRRAVIAEGWESCPLGCGLTHKIGDVDPMHENRWLVSERDRLLGIVDRAHRLLWRWWKAPAPWTGEAPLGEATAVFFAPVNSLPIFEEPPRRLALVPMPDEDGGSV